MDINNANIIKKVREAKIEMSNNTGNNSPINKEQKFVIDELEEVLNFLKSRQIKDEDVLINIKKPLNDLRSSLKYIPTEPYFELIPAEIKTKILSYLCDTDAFTAAAVCQEWKAILGSRFTGKRVAIGRRCCFNFICCNMLKPKCWKNSVMLKASATHKLQAHLTISDSVTKVKSKIVTKGLTSVNKFTLVSDCTCDYEWVRNDCEVNPLSIHQLEDLFRGLEEKMETMEEVKLLWLDLSELNQDRLVHCFVNKIRNLTLHESKYHGDKMFNVETLINKLLQESGEKKLNQLTLDILEYPPDLDLELANALCNIENVKLCENFPLRSALVTQLFENILSDTLPVIIKIMNICPILDFRAIINPDDLKKLFTKMTTLKLDGRFTVEQVEAARSLPDVDIWTTSSVRSSIKKGFHRF